MPNRGWPLFRLCTKCQTKIDRQLLSNKKSRISRPATILMVVIISDYLANPGGSMKDNLTRALAFPRDLIKLSLVREECPQNWNFSTEATECLTCHDGQECNWLVRNDEFAALEERSLETLVTDLEIALDIVRAHVACEYHAPRMCSCSACAWLKHAQTIRDDYSQRTYRQLS